jgi:hypothetical protein
MGSTEVPGSLDLCDQTHLIGPVTAKLCDLATLGKTGFSCGVATTVRRPQSSNWNPTQDKIGVIILPASDYDVPEFIEHIFDWLGCSNGLPVTNH